MRTFTLIHKFVEHECRSISHLTLFPLIYKSICLIKCKYDYKTMILKVLVHVITRGEHLSAHFVKTERVVLKYAGEKNCLLFTLIHLADCCSL